jgi:hypothetical protein
MSVIMKKILQKLMGSLNTRMPINAVPIAPMPVHTAYAVPIGRLCVALTNSTILMVNEIKNPPYHQYTSFPVASFALPKHDANATSNNPATINMIQFMVFYLFAKIKKKYRRAIKRETLNSGCKKGRRSLDRFFCN